MTIDPKRLHEAKKKAKKRCPRRNFWSDESWARCLRKAKDTTTPCSCSACCNGRRKDSYNKGKGRLTLQERKRLQKEREE
jgi:hypothetical protein